MTEATKIIDWSKVELEKLFKVVPVVVKTYGPQALEVCNTIKAALQTPEAALIEDAIEHMIPGAGVWEAAIVTAISKALGVAIPMITKIDANAATGESLNAQALQLVQYLQTLSPFMQHAGLLKLLSGLFLALDSKLTELETDSAAQTLYAVSKSQAA